MLVMLCTYGNRAYLLSPPIRWSENSVNYQLNLFLEGGEFLSVWSGRTCFLSLPFSSWGMVFQLLQRHTLLSIVFAAVRLQEEQKGREEEHSGAKQMFSEGCEYLGPHSKSTRLFCFPLNAHYLASSPEGNTQTCRV